ncbi:hypothetical protein SteCoe_31166 [Stentor coeruleus]|uniref:Tyrosine-protein kinase ephrin type A/B receptor-like domain-containing protein n=1 Tax=Stentor coeruleus TaxID=5963 RepID=A0A1R2B1Y4_9CILI|nr:hypothetical protein SteCoe_31166 [Stentor coeruleus]
MYSYWQNSIYYFSGSYFTSKSKFFHSQPRAKFARIDFKLICEKFNCSFECSPGFILHKSNCILCPPGTYSSNNQCLQCKKGYFNPLPGASSIMQCYPCPEGSFNNKEGSSLCKICPIGYICYAGCFDPKLLQKKLGQIMEIPSQSILKDNNKNIRNNIFLLAYIIPIIVSIVFFTKDKLKIIIIKIDLYPDCHNYRNGEKILSQKNALGAAFTLILYFTFAYMGGKMIFSYFIENEYKEYSLVTLDIVNHLYKDFKADFDIYISVQNYADQCTNNINLTESSNFTKCSPNIFESLNALKRQKTSINCMILKDHSCAVKFSCIGCTVDTSSSITLKFNGNFSYGSGFFVNFTSKSYVINSNQRTFSEIYPKSNHVFTGSQPSIFNFLLTPSLFITPIDSHLSILAGYHSKEISLPIEGSQKNVMDFFSSNQLQVKIVLEKDIHGFVTEIHKYQNYNSLLAALFGTFTGLMSFMGFSLRVTEKLARVKIFKNKIKPFKKIVGLRRHFTDILEGVEEGYENIVSSNGLISTENERY